MTTHSKLCHIYVTLMHLPNTFIWSYLHCIQCIHVTCSTCYATTSIDVFTLKKVHLAGSRHWGKRTFVCDYYMTSEKSKPLLCWYYQLIQKELMHYLDIQKSCIHTCTYTIPHAMNATKISTSILQLSQKLLGKGPTFFHLIAYCSYQPQ